MERKFIFAIALYGRLALFVCYLFGIRHVQKIRYKLANTTSYKTPKSQNAGITHKVWLHKQTDFQCMGSWTKRIKHPNTKFYPLCFCSSLFAVQIFMGSNFCQNMSRRKKEKRVLLCFLALGFTSPTYTLLILVCCKTNKQTK